MEPSQGVHCSGWVEKLGTKWSWNSMLLGRKSFPWYPPHHHQVLLVSTPTNAETETLSIEECLEADQVRDSRKGPCYPDYPSVPVEKRKGKLDFSAAGRKKRLIQLKWFRSLLQWSQEIRNLVSNLIKYISVDMWYLFFCAKCRL